MPQTKDLTVKVKIRTWHIRVSILIFRVLFKIASYSAIRPFFHLTLRLLLPFSAAKVK